MAIYDAPSEPRLVPAGHGVEWFSGGWRVFMAAPAVWVLIGVAFAIIHILLGMVPGLGSVAYLLLLPVLAAGLMEASRIAESGAPLSFDMLFAGFRHRTGNLVMVGLLMLCFFIVISAISFVILIVGGASSLSLLKQIVDAGFDATAIAANVNVGMILGSILLAMLVFSALSLPLTMAAWFAPALVFFEGMAPFNAMKSSFYACLRNWLAFFVYSVLLLVLAFIAAIPLGLGFLVLIPVAATSIYVSYRDIYHGAHE
ncbi:MAG: BPSS1780 family membrane protein [Georgfuchsia sp.]